MSALNSQARLNRWVALLGVTALILYLSWKVLEPFVEVLILGIALTIIFQPLHKRFVRWTGGNRWAAVLSTLVTLIVILVPVTFVTLTVIHELPRVSQTVQDGVTALQEKWKAAAGSGSWLADLRERWKLDDAFSPEDMKQYTASARDFLVPKAVALAGGVLQFLLGFVLLLFVLFFLFRDGQKLGARFVDFLPMARDQALVLVKRTEEVLAACVYGVIMVAAVQGTLGGITFWLLGLPSPVTWGLVMTLLCTLPIVGAWLVWVPAAIGLAMSGDYTKAVILAIVGQFVISSIDNILRPVLVGQRAKLHELVIFFSVLGGLKYFGLLGILLGP
ncbi:MAG TPA: AI-2E family transporter, partial [Verrucomicrobiales bacterium]|nr:AI-2E family transporter [Verrucomicrobiales bacterium]